ncbi:MAG: polysaccharide pyruvyl transferase family protein, partial [Elainellaceae cyanobacterium]
MQQDNQTNEPSFHDSLHYDRFRRWRDYLRPQPVLGYIGCVGYGNFGDDLLFAAIARLFSQQLIAYDGATQPIHRDPKYHLRRRLRLYRRVMKPALYDGVLLGSGTLINRDALLSRLQKAVVRYPCATFGIGVCDPLFWQQHDSTVDHRQRLEAWATTLKSARYLSVRGPKSAQILQSYGLDPQVIGDPVLSSAMPRTDYRRTRRVAVTVNNHDAQWGNQDTINQAVQRLCFALHRQGWWVEVLAFNDADLAIATQISEALSKVFDRPFPRRLAGGISKTLDYIKSCDLVIGQHLDAAVAAHACGVPTILLSYAPECDDYMASMDLELFTVRTDGLAPTEQCIESILSLTSWIGDRYGEHCQQVRDKVEHYQQVQAATAETISQ